MDRYKLTKTWKNTLGSTCPESQNAIDRLRHSFEGFRGKVVLLAAEINRSLPDYTVHDITHIDALWDLSDLICGDDFSLNPVEGFVLGGAFLLHDLAMSICAYPNGIADLEETQLWNDTVVQRFTQLRKPVPDSLKYIDLPESDKSYVVSTVLRKLHASSAEKLVSSAWKQKTTGEQIFLIEDIEIRQALGRTIGEIAHSHWWDLPKVESEFSRTLGSPSWCSAQWTIDPLKIACILRVADASHIDARRAPPFLRVLRNLSASSDDHWCFQEKMQRPYLSEDSLVYTSGHSFNSDEASSWWLCYEALRMIDKELRQTDALLADKGMQRFVAKRVFGIESPERLSGFIKSEDWSPIDAFIHIGDLPKIIRNLGGEELYGRDYSVPIRELIQNGADAIVARRVLENRGEGWGSIGVSYLVEGDKHYLQVEDSGIGMSIEVVRRYLFDFGTSYWGSDLMQEEYPGLISQDIEHVGKYGIGFFSSFMLGESIQITTRKCSAAQNDTHIIEFRSGLNARPIIRKSKPSEYLLDGGTRIKIEIIDAGVLKSLFELDKGGEVSLRDRCISIAPALGVDIHVHEPSGDTVLRRDHWVNCSGKDFMRLIKTLNIFSSRGSYENLEDFQAYFNDAEKNIRVLRDDNGVVIGRGFISPNGLYAGENAPHLRGYVVVGGLVEGGTHGIVGVFKGVNNNAARDESNLLAGKELLAEWASEQSNIVMDIVTDRAGLSCSQITRILGGTSGGLPVAMNDRKFYTYDELSAEIAKVDRVVLVDRRFMFLRAKDFDSLVVEDNVFFAPLSGVPTIVDFSFRRGIYKDGSDWNFSHTNAGYFCEIIAEKWGVPMSILKGVVDPEDADRPSEKILIATNNTKQIMERGLVFDRNVLTS